MALPQGHRPGLIPTTVVTMSTVPSAETVGTVRWRWGTVFALAWLVFLVQPLWGAFTSGTTSGRVGGVTLLVFAAAYVVAVRGLAPVFRSDHPEPPVRIAATIAVMVVCAAVAVVALGADGLATTPYLAVVGPILFRRAAVAWVLGCAAAAEVLTWAFTGSWSQNLGVATGTLSAGLSVWGFALLMQRQRDQLRASEAEARLAVVEERGRFARDLHDILGHSLTVITIKAELAGRMLDLDADRARSEVADVERLAREALIDVRRAVEGYREISLAGELARARDALRSAAIAAHLPGAVDEIPRDLEELFAWTVREGVTNVLRHSAADSCTVTITSSSITVSDDGRGAGSEPHSGNGMRGLRERAAQAGVVLVVESAPERGYRLTVGRPAEADGRAIPAPEEVSS